MVACPDIGAPSGVWYIDGRHQRPANVDETLVAQHTGWIRSAMASASASVRDAISHFCWGLGTWAERPDGIPWVTYSYVQRGAAISSRAAREGSQEACRILGATRDRLGCIHARPEAVAACYDIAKAEIAEGRFSEPAVCTPVMGPAMPVALGPDVEGKCRCVCDGHNNGDRNPSAVYNKRSGCLTCLVTRQVFRISRVGLDWVARARDPENTPATAATRVINNSTRGAPPGSPGRTPDRQRFVLTRAIRDMGSSASSGDPVWEETTWEGAMLERHAPYTDKAWKTAEWAARDGELDDALIMVDTPKANGESLGLSRVLFDLDDLDWAPTDWEEVLPEVEAVVTGSPLFDRALSTVETSPTGVQVAAGLEVFRWDAHGFYRDAEVLAELRRVGEALRALLRRGGRVDEGVWRRRRMARLPGPRVKDGAVVNARLVGLWDGGLRAIKG